MVETKKDIPKQAGSINPVNPNEESGWRVRHEMITIWQSMIALQWLKYSLRKSNR